MSSFRENQRATFFDANLLAMGERRVSHQEKKSLDIMYTGMRRGTGISPITIEASDTLFDVARYKSEGDSLLVHAEMVTHLSTL